jgi:uroporphyrinogen III methyltransferase / synthase
VRPLEGKRVAVTRAENQADDLCARLQAAGATPVRCATIQMAPPESYAELDHALAHLDAYGWLVFTSANGVRFLIGRMDELGVPRPRLESLRVAAVGPPTASALLEHGIRADLVPEEGGSAALAAALTPVRGMRVLLARGDLADGEPTHILRRRGASGVDTVVAYRTVPIAPTPEAVEELSAGIDGVTFTSPSTVQGFAKLGPRWRDLVGGAVVATIGPVTTAAAREAGLNVQAEAAERTMGGLVAALEKGFAEKVETTRKGAGR